MDFVDLTLFSRAATLGNLSAAGRELKLSPAVASTRLTKLERSLGARLLQRTTRRISLTEEGRVFLKYAEQILNDFAAATAAVGAGLNNPRGTLTVAASASFGRQHIAPAVPEFLARYPELSLELRLTDRVTDLVQEAIDVAVRIGPLPDSTLIARRLAPSHRVVCAAPRYIERHGAPEAPEGLSAHNCLVLSNQRSWSFRTASGVETVRVSGSLTADNGEALREAAAAGLGIALLSDWNAHEALRSGALVQILPGFPVVYDATVWAVYPSARFLAPKVRVFIDFFAARFDPQPNWGDLT